MALTAIEGSAPIRKLRSQGQRWPQGEAVPPDWIEEGHEVRKRAGLPRINLALEAEKFVDFWIGKSGQGASKLDWRATFRNWCRNARGQPEADPVKVKEPPGNVMSRRRAELAAKGIRHAMLDRRDLELGVREGILSIEQAKKMGL